MNKTTIIFVLGILTWSPVDADDQFKTALPAASALTRTPQVRADDSYVYFRGQVTLQVAYRFIHSNADSPYSENPHLFFMPDEKALAGLPYLIERGKPERPSEILVLNAKEAAEVLLSKQLVSELKAGKLKVVSGTATVVIDNFGAGYSCDSPSFLARFVSLEHVVVAAAPSSQERHGC